MSMPQNPYSHGGERSGCQDRVISKSTGGGKLGFPLEMTQTMRSGGQNSFSQTITTVEFSKSALDDGLFNVPADYRLANSPQDLYGQPDMSGMMSGRQDPANDYGATNPNISRQNANMNGKRPGMVRIGVLMPTNRNGDPVSTSGLQSYLASELRQGKVEGLVVSSESEARAAGCDYLLTSDISKLKQSTAGKVGGIFGKVTGVPTAGVYDAQVEFTLVSLADGRNVLKTKLTNKAETDATRAAEAVLSSEAQAVLAAAK
jgi:hypothetical protein